MKHIVNAVFLGPEGVLLGRRSLARKAYPGLWSFPGGHVEDGETLEEALIREVGEELGVVPLRYAFLMRIADPNSAPEEIAYHMFAVLEWSGQPAIADAEHSELKWFDLEEARALSDLALQEYRTLFHRLGRVSADASTEASPSSS